MEPELPSDSYFIMIMPEQVKFTGEGAPITSEVESPDISYSEPSLSKGNLPSKPKRLFNVHPETTKEKLKHNKPEKLSSDAFFENDEIKFPLIMSGSIAND
jgi:hypothetical protein